MSEDIATTEGSAPTQTIEEIAAEVFGEAAPAPEPDKPAPVVEPPKDPAAERVAARIEAARKADLRAAKSRQELAAQKADIDKQRAELAEMAKTAEALKTARLSPSKALELLGFKPKDFLEALATENEPEAIAKRAVEGTQSVVEKLQARIDAMEAAEKQRELDAKLRVVDADYNAATQQFLEYVDSAPDKYPHLNAEFTKAEIARYAQQAADQHAEPYFKQFGVYPDDEVIAEHLETTLGAARAAELAERRARLGQKAQQPSKGEPTGDLRVAQPEKGPSPRTLTSRTASEKATTQKPWSQEWADEESLRILNASLKTG